MKYAIADAFLRRQKKIYFISLGIVILANLFVLLVFQRVMNLNMFLISAGLDALFCIIVLIIMRILFFRWENSEIEILDGDLIVNRNGKIKRISLASIQKVYLYFKAEKLIMIRITEERNALNAPAIEDAEAFVQSLKSAFANPWKIESKSFVPFSRLLWTMTFSVALSILLAISVRDLLPIGNVFFQSEIPNYYFEIILRAFAELGMGCALISQLFLRNRFAYGVSAMVGMFTLTNLFTIVSNLNFSLVPIWYLTVLIFNAFVFGAGTFSAIVLLAKAPRPFQANPIS